MSGDLRDVPSERFWEQLSAAMGKDGLLTYRYLGRKTATMHGVAHDSMILRRDMRNAQGGLMAAPLAIAAAEAGGFTDFNAVPAPITASLTLIDPGLDVTELRIDREIVHAGRNMGFTRSIISDASDPKRILALTRGTGIKLGEAPSEGGSYFDLGEQIADSPDLPALTHVFGGHVSEGQWQLPALTAETRSTSGSLHLGPIHVILEAAAMDAATREATGEALQIEEWEVMFTARGLTGPFVAHADVAYRAGSRIAVRLSLRDQGRNNRVIASAASVFRTTS